MTKAIKESAEKIRAGLQSLADRDIEQYPYTRAERASVYRALCAVLANQTADEQQSQSTNKLNGMGFTGADAQILTDIAQKSLQYGSLSQKQTRLCVKKLAKYSRQLAEAKANPAAPVVTVNATAKVSEPEVLDSSNSVYAYCRICQQFYRRKGQVLDPGYVMRYVAGPLGSAMTMMHTEKGSECLNRIYQIDEWDPRPSAKGRSDLAAAMAWLDKYFPLPDGQRFRPVAPYFVGTYQQFVSGIAVNQKVSLQYLIQSLVKFGCTIDENQVIETLEDMMGYDRDSEVELFASAD